MRKIVIIIGLCLFVIGLNLASGKNPEEKRRLRILSYNIRHAEGSDGKVDLNRIADIIIKKKPDLVALQEVDKNCSRSGKIDIAAELGKILSMEHRFAKFMDFQGGEYGMAVLSRFPIKETIVHTLPEGAEPRCALEVRVDTEVAESVVSFICIHNDWTEESIRLEQVNALLGKIMNYNNPVILAGDFNGERSDSSLKLFEKKGWTILNKDGEKTWPSVDPEVEIDFFIVRGFKNISYYTKVIDERVASDHRPIFAEIIFTGGRL